MQKLFSYFNHYLGMGKQNKTTLSDGVNSGTYSKLNQNKKGKVFVFTGPSGVGKSTIVDIILKQKKLFKRIVTFTTRAPRVGEVNGVDYNFVSVEEFEGFVKDSLLLEHANVYEHYYGMLKSDVDEVLDSGKNVLCTLDVQGALTVKKKIKGSVTIFVKAPTLEIMRTRLIKRGKDTMDVIDARLKQAREEIKLEKKFNYIIINDLLDRAVKETKEIIFKELKK